MQFRGAKIVIRDGDDPKDIKDDIHHAWLDLQDMKRIYGTTGFHSQIRGGGKWKIQSHAGIDIIYMLGKPEPLPEVEKKEKKIKKRRIRFVPAIGLVDPLEVPDIRQYPYTQYDFIFDDYIFYLSDWKIFATLSEDQPENIAVGTKRVDIKERRIYSCTELGDCDPSDWDFWDDEIVDEDSYSDNGFTPLPYLGYSYSDCGQDQICGDIVGIVGALYGGAADICDSDSGLFTSLSNGDWPSTVSPPWHEVAPGVGRYKSPEGACVDQDEHGCCLEKDEDVYFLASSRCGEDFLMAENNLASYQATTFYT